MILVNERRFGNAHVHKVSSNWKVKKNMFTNLLLQKLVPKSPRVNCGSSLCLKCCAAAASSGARRADPPDGPVARRWIVDRETSEHRSPPEPPPGGPAGRILSAIKKIVRKIRIRNWQAHPVWGIRAVHRPDTVPPIAPGSPECHVNPQFFGQFPEAA